MSFDHCRVVPVVCRFSDHKCRHGNVYVARCNATRKKTVLVIIISNYVHWMQQMPPLLWVLFVFVSSRRDTASQYGKGRNISIIRLRYSSNPNALDSWPIRAHLASQNDELCKKSTHFRKAGHRGATVIYSMWKIMCFLNLKPHKHIALHQIHKIMFFLATSYDPFKR